MNHERLLWASDHPHSDATFPNSQQVLAEQTARPRRPTCATTSSGATPPASTGWRTSRATGGLTWQPTSSSAAAPSSTAPARPASRADVAITDGQVSARSARASTATAVARRRRPRRRARASSTSTPTTTRRSSGTRRSRPSCYHGVTTVVAGNCGFSIAPTRPEHRELIARTLENVEDMNVASLAAGIPWDFSTFPEYLASVERRGTGLNYAAYIGHTALRLFVMGDDAYERVATPDEIAGMQAVLREAHARRRGRAARPASRSRTAASTASRSRAASRTAPSSRRCSTRSREVGRGRRRDRAG